MVNRVLCDVYIYREKVSFTSFIAVTVLKEHDLDVSAAPQVLECE